MADYPEQVTITGVKANQHCPICLVPPDQRENLTVSWPLRTHETTKEQIRRQNTRPKKGVDQMDVHRIHNFAWNHSHVNIHGIIMLDILHQLLKGCIMTLLKWIRSLIDNSVQSSRKRKNIKQGLNEASPTIQLDARFRQVPEFTGLKRFTGFSAVSQWTGNEQKAIIRQLIPVLAPLLVKTAPSALQYARAVLDFVMLAMYHAHDDKTLSYIGQALYRIDKFKLVFAAYRPTHVVTDDRGENEAAHFNIPKLHALTHYVDFIRRYGSAQNFDTCYGEAAHKFLLKDFFPRTNKSQKFDRQILDHNIRRVNMLAMADLLQYRDSRRRTTSDAALDIHVNKPGRLVERFQPWEEGLDYSEMARYGLNPRQWRTASWIATQDEIKEFDFIDALAVFVQEHRNLGTLDSGLSSRREKDPAWVSNYYVALRHCIVCWAPDGRDPDCVERPAKVIARCAPNWQNRGAWRRDYVWFKGATTTYLSEKKEDQAHDMELGQLKLIVTVIDPEYLDENGKPRRYTGALIEMFRWRKNGEADEIHGMFEVEQIPPQRARCPRTLGAFRFIPYTQIIRTAHLVPSGGPKPFYYVNNFIDWDQYNTIYREDFMSEGIQIADAFSRSQRRV